MGERSIPILDFEQEHTLVHDDHRVHLDRWLVPRIALQRRIKQLIRRIGVRQHIYAGNLSRMNPGAAQISDSAYHERSAPSDKLTLAAE
jgi:hypothetical protein